MSGSDYAENKIFQGLGCGSGKAVGEVIVVRHKKMSVPPRVIQKSEVKKELSKFSRARDELAEELEGFLNHVHEKNSEDILGTLRQIIYDPDLEIKVQEQIQEKHLNVEFAVYQAYCDFIEKLKESGSELFRQRISDLTDLRDRMIDLITRKAGHSKVKKGQIIVTTELSPTDVVEFHEQGIAGIIMEKGGVTSHSAIIAQSLEIPCIVNLKDAMKAAAESDVVAMDGDNGMVIFRPDGDTEEEYSITYTDQPEDQKGPHIRHETKDGTAFRLMVNLEFRQELERLHQQQYEGIGLLRTEGLVFGKVVVTAEEQHEYYEDIFRRSEGPVIVRLFDLGGDKLNKNFEKELNPFLGWRGIRMLLDEEHLLMDQLKALLKVASDFPGRLRVLIPMVTMVEEVEKVRGMIQTIQNDISDPDPDVKVGIMVEVPAVALKAEQFAKQVDFFSIGTNDLTQYTLAVDRGNEKIHSLYQQFDPSVLKLIKLTAEAANKYSIPVSVCGELAGTTIGAALILGMGITDLSMSPRSLHKIRDTLTGLEMSQLRAFSDSALTQSSANDVRDLFNKIMSR